MKLSNDGTFLFVTLKPEDGLKELAAQAVQIQDACNLCGLAQRFAEVMKQLLHHPQNKVGTTWANKSPITLLWIDKFAHLSGYKQDYGIDAYQKCMDLADGKEIEWRLPLDSSDQPYWKDKASKGEIEKE